MEFGPYYLVKDLPLYELITHEFINTFIKKGKKNHVLSVNVVGCGRPGRSHHNSRAPALFEPDWWSSSARSGVCSRPSTPQQLSLLRALSGWVSDSTGPHASRGGVVTQGSWRGEALWCCVSWCGHAAFCRAGCWRGPASSAWTLRPSVHLCLLGWLACSGYFLGAPRLKPSQCLSGSILTAASLRRGHWPFVYGLASMIPFVSFETRYWGIPWRSVVRTPGFHCPRPGFSPWSGNWDNTNYVLQPKKKSWML